MTTYNTIPDDEALLAPKKQKSFRGLVAGAAMASFLLGMVAATAVSTKPMGALTLNSVYDSGYREGVDRGGEKKLWCGLGLSEHLNVNPAIGGRDASVRELADKLHGKGMALMTWVNPSYFWTGSAHFKQAEADMWNAGGDMSQTPDDSPARWFKWGPLEWGEVDKPGDDVYLEDKGTWRWVKDYDANAAYLSVWADQPSTDFMSEGWQNELGLG